MLASPDRNGKAGFVRSVRAHNNSHTQFCDWLEGCALVDGDISYPEIVDFLSETHVYDSADLAWEFLESVRVEARRRADLLGDAYPLEPKIDNILRRELRGSDLPYVFCLLLSFPFHFRQWATAHIPPTGPHRSLFERVSEQACQRLFPNWLVTSFGWSPETTMRKGEIVERVAGALHSSVRDPSVFENSNDAGVDILCHLLLSDSWGGYPAIMVQCATGRTDYFKKAVEPNLNMWRAAVDLRNMPKRLLSVPFALDRDELWKLTTAADGTILDRVRLISGFRNSGPIPTGLLNDLRAWCEGPLAELPRFT
jgi:hypothetical protein